MKIFDRQRDVCEWKYFISKVTVSLKDKSAKYKVCVATPTSPTPQNKQKLPTANFQRWESMVHFG